MTPSPPRTEAWHTQFDWRILLLFVSLAILVSLYTRTYGKWVKGGILVLLIVLYYFVLYWSTHS
jgi:Ca2+/Na+ antiporter